MAWEHTFPLQIFQVLLLELMVAQDGGVPMASKSWDGNVSDSQIFKERAEALFTTLFLLQAQSS